jgi:hypothetical protein
MSNGRKLRKGYILKSVFCRENNITISEFNKVMQEKGYLVKTLISINGFGGDKKYALSINSKYITPLHGSNQQGSYQYSKNFLLDVFGIESMTKGDYSKYRLTFGKYKGFKLSEKQKQYLKWIHGSMKKDNDTITEKFRAINWFVTNIK